MRRAFTCTCVKYNELEVQGQGQISPGQPQNHILHIFFISVACLIFFVYVSLCDCQFFDIPGYSRRSVTLKFHIIFVSVNLSTCRLAFFRTKCLLNAHQIELKLIQNWQNVIRHGTQIEMVSILIHVGQFYPTSNS